MFSRISRYRKLPDVVTVDARGRVLASRALRLPPATPGTFLHTVEGGDRLDHLGFKYYDQSRDWWRIADANPAFLSPQALLGGTPRRTIEVPVAWEGASPPWSELLRSLRERPGVESALLGTSGQAHPLVEVVDGPLAFDVAPALTAELDASVRAQEVPGALAAALAAGGVAFAGEVRPEKVDAATWRITDLETGAIHTFRHFPDEGLLNVYPSALRSGWTLVLTYNTLVVSPEELLALIEGAGFPAGTPGEVHRIGKPIVIPPRAG